MPASTMHTLADNFGSHLASSGSHAIPEQDKPKAVLTTRHVSRLRSSEDHESKQLHRTISVTSMLTFEAAQQTASLASGLSDAQAVLRCTKRLSMALLTGIAAAGFVDERFLPDLSLRVRHISHNVQRLKRNTEFLRSAAGNKLFQCLRQEIEQVKCLWIKYDALQTAYVECDKQELTKATEPHQGGHKEAYEAFVINKYVEGAHLPGDRIWEAGDLPFPSICYDTTIWPTWHRLREAGRADRSQVFESGKVIFPRAVYTILEHWRKDVKSVLQSVLQIQNTQGVRDMEVCVVLPRSFGGLRLILAGCIERYLLHQRPQGEHDNTEDRSAHGARIEGGMLRRG